MEIVLIRIDHFRDRAAYLRTLRSWLQQTEIANGRLISQGTLLLLFLAAPSASQVDALLSRYQMDPIDTNARNEPCIDRFIDVIGRKQVDGCACRGFTELNLLTPKLVQELLVDQWGAESAWIQNVMVNARTESYLRWKDEAKKSRKQRRKRTAQDRYTHRKQARTTSSTDISQVEPEGMTQA
ncbi:hypothetical protein ABG067_005782 [Albugo candida]